MTAKFHEKNIAIFGITQPVEGTPTPPLATDVIAALTLDGVVNRETESFEFVGDSLDRGEVSTLKDTSGEITFEAMMPVLGVIDTGLPVDSAPYSKFLQACGGFVTVDGGTGKVTIDNATVSDDLLTIDYRKSSPEVTVANTQKLTRFFDCRGQVDVALEASTRTKLTFKFFGNDSAPVMSPELIPDFGLQKSNIAAVFRKNNVVTATIQELLGAEAAKNIATILGNGSIVTVTFATAHNLDVGDEITVAGTTNYNTTGKLILSVPNATTLTYSDTVSLPQETVGTVTRTAHKVQTMCINSFNAPNFYGFDYERYLLSCQEGFSKGATPTDVTAVVLEDEAGGADFDPEANIEKYFEVILKYGTGAGKYVTIQMDNLQLVNSKDTKIGTFFGKEVSFRNIGKSYLIFE